MLSDIVLLAVLGLSTLLIQLLGFLLILRLLRHRETRPEWWAWGRIAGCLGLSLPIWFLAHAGIPVNTTAGFWVIFLLLTAVLVLPRFQLLQQVRVFLRRYGKNILLQEIIFLAGMIFLGTVRTFHPEILDLEKFMNAGLIQGYLRSPLLPAEDFWLAGSNLNYYSFGHFLSSLLLRFWQLPVETGFAVLLGWIMGLVLVETFGLVQTLLGPFLSSAKQRSGILLAAGLTGAALMVFGGNSHPVWYFLAHQGFAEYWYPDVTRFIEHSIHEIPAYSFIVSDLHAHFLDIPVVLLTLFMAWQWLNSILSLKQYSWQSLRKNIPFMALSLTLGVLLGVMGMSNTWDLLIYSIFLLLIGATAWIGNIRLTTAIVFSGTLACAAALLTLAPWYLNFSSIISGVFWVPEHSPLWQLAALWLGHAAFSLIAAAAAWFAAKKRFAANAPLIFLLGLCVSALLFLILPEMIYFKDIYPTFPRANTMFKFAFQAFIMMNLLLAWLIGFLLQRKTILKLVLQRLLLLAAGGYIALVLAYPFLGYPNYYNGFRRYSGLDGLAWLRQSAPQEYEAVLWLRDHTQGRPVILEAVGESYTEYGRMSVFSGLPTVLGWRAHEWLWRGGYAIPAQRTEEVKAVYERPRGVQALAVLNKYQVRFIIVGSKERESYQLDMAGLESLGTIVFQRGRVLIIERSL